MKWQPIATIPKDGTPVLTWDGGNIEIWYWYGGSWLCPDRCYPEDDVEFTHWMPLPEPPGETE